MTILIKKILSISIVVSIFLFNGCTSTSSELISVSDTHPYNKNFGIIPDKKVDNILKEEVLVEKEPVEVEIPKSNDPEIYVGLKYDPEAVTADKYVEVPPVITYKYPFDPKFYTANDLRRR